MTAAAVTGATSWPLLSTASPAPRSGGSLPPNTDGTSPHVQLHRGVQPSRGGPWGREDHARQGSRRDLVCRVHPVEGRGQGRGGQIPVSIIRPRGHKGEQDPEGGVPVSSIPREPPKYSQRGQADRGSLSRLFVQGDQRHRAGQRYLGVRGCREHPVGTNSTSGWGQRRGPPSQWRGWLRDAGLGRDVVSPSIPSSMERVQPGGVTYDGAVSARRALLAGGAGGASGARLTGAASRAGFTTGSFATFLPAGAGGTGKADVSLDGAEGGGRDAIRQQPRTPPAAS